MDLHLDENNFVHKIIENIDTSIKKKEQYVVADFEWLGGERLKKLSSNPMTSNIVLAPNSQVVNTLTKIYNNLKDKYWNEQKIGLIFSGQSGGTKISIEYGDGKNINKRKQILKKCLSAVLTLKKNETKYLDFRTISMKGTEWYTVIKSVDNELQPYSTIIMKDGRWLIKCLQSL